MYSHPEHKDTTLSATGVDLLRRALDLARENQKIQLNEQLASTPKRQKSLESMAFVQANVLMQEPTQEPSANLPVLQALQRLDGGRQTRYDILISNPPYISSKDYMRTTSPSVRSFEPKLALVPAKSYGQHAAVSDGDLFYPRLLHIAKQVEAKVLLFEVADLDQAKRIAQLVASQGIWHGIEVWRDHPSNQPMAEEHTLSGTGKVAITGFGNGRSVLAYRDAGIAWIGR